MTIDTNLLILVATVLVFVLILYWVRSNKGKDTSINGESGGTKVSFEATTPEQKQAASQPPIDKSIHVGGNATNNTMITGDNNKV